MAFPSVLNSFTRPNATDRLNNPSHSALHNTISSALGQVEAVIGVDGASSVVGTMMYDLRSPASGGGGHVQVVNKGGTGFTSYTKGDILVAQSSSVLTKLSVGTDGYLLNANSTQATGIQWVAPTASALGVGVPSIVFYQTSSILTWVKPSLLSYVVVQAVGGGAGGSWSSGSGSGAGSVAGNTYFGSLLTAIGGGPGTTGGTGGIGGYVNIAGQGGQSGVNYGSGNPARGGDGGLPGNGWGSKGVGGEGQASAANETSGAGGGGGEYRMGIFPASLLSENVAVGIGAGASGGGTGQSGAIIISTYQA